MLTLLISERYQHTETEIMMAVADGQWRDKSRVRRATRRSRALSDGLVYVSSCLPLYWETQSGRPVHHSIIDNKVYNFVYLCLDEIKDWCWSSDVMKHFLLLHKIHKCQTNHKIIRSRVQTDLIIIFIRNSWLPFFGGTLDFSHLSWPFLYRNIKISLRSKEQLYL